MMVASSQGHYKDKAHKLESMTGLLDKESVKEMMVERCTWKNGTSMPLALWMCCNNGNYKKTHFIEVLVKYSTGEELEMINGEGDLPLHTVRTSSFSSKSHLANNLKGSKTRPLAG
jgi:hypothetical protein